MEHSDQVHRSQESANFQLQIPSEIVPIVEYRAAHSRNVQWPGNRHHQLHKIQFAIDYLVKKSYILLVFFLVRVSENGSTTKR